MSSGQHAKHAKGFVVFDKAHATHVGGEIKNDCGVPDSFGAVGETLKVQYSIFYVVRGLVPLAKRFLIYRTDHIDAICQQVFNEMTADKSTGAANHDFFFS